MRVCKGWCLLLFVFIGFNGCKVKPQADVRLPEEGAFFDRITEYGLLSVSNNGILPGSALIPYQVINSLFTDYARKDRLIYVPDGEKLTLNEDGSFDFPAGCVIVKNFFYDENQVKSGMFMETRLLIKDTEEWKAVSYLWNEEQSEAFVSKVGTVTPLTIQHETRGALSFDYIVPNKNQCKSCHNENESIDPLGFEYKNINREVATARGPQNQIDYFVEIGILDRVIRENFTLSTMLPYEDESVPLQDRALGYLDVNCGHCHRPEGPGNTSGLFLQFNEKRVNHLGFCKAPVAAGKGSGGRKFDILPGMADSSILVHRMGSLDPGVMMPELGRSLVHEEGLLLVKEWIDSIDYDCYAD